MSSRSLFLKLCRDMLDSGCLVRFPAPGHSMHPTIRSGEVITVEPVNPCEVRPGDIVLYRSAPGPIAHRLIKRTSADLFLLRGDASARCDEAVSPEQILGRVVSVERGCSRLDLKSRRSRFWQRLRAAASRWRRSNPVFKKAASILS